MDIETIEWLKSLSKDMKAVKETLQALTTELLQIRKELKAHEEKVDFVHKL